MRAALFILSSALLSGAVYSQARDTVLLPRSSNDGMESVAQESETSRLAEILDELAEHPIDLNTASLEELLQLPWLTVFIAERIIVHRIDHRFRSVDELAGLDGVSPDVVERSRRYVSVGQSNDFHETIYHVTLRSKVRGDLKVRKGFENGEYRGSRMGRLNRVRLTIDDAVSTISRVETGIVSEQDAGETAANGNTSWSIAATSKELGLHLVVGDYAAEFGEGLVLWRSFGPSKGSEVFSAARKRGGGIKSGPSTDETWTLRGAALEWKSELASAVAFYSSRALSGTVDSLGSGSSIYTEGLFRTPSEIAKRNSLRERLIGVRAAVAPAEGLTMGVTSYTSSFSVPVNLSQGTASNAVAVTGVDVAYTDRTLDCFSELAYDHHGHTSLLLGAFVAPASSVSAGIVGRSYAAEMQNLRGFAFGERAGPPQNEEGLYFALRVTPLRGWRFSAYSDAFSSTMFDPTLRLPDRGSDLLLNLNVEPNVIFRGELQYKNKESPRSVAGTDAWGRTMVTSEERDQQNFRLTIERNSARSVSWKTRAEVVLVSGQGAAHLEQGTLLYQDIRFDPGTNYSITARLIFFRTSSFDSRLYEYESDLQGSFANPALFGSGLRWYAIVRMKLSEALAIAMKYAYSYKDNARSLSSGAQSIAGPIDNSISVQVDASY